MGYVDFLDNEHLIPGNSIAVGMMGMKFFFMGSDFYAGQFTKTAFPKFDGFNKRVALWFIAWFNKSSSRYLSVLVRDFEKEFYNTTLLVPYKDGKVCTSFIEERVRELEEERVRELEAYLEACGFEDCELTEEETIALESFNAHAISSIRIEDLFTAQTGDVDLQKKDINGKGEIFVNSGLQNLGIKGRTDRKAKIFPSNTITIDFWGYAFFRPFNYKMATHNHVFSLSGEVIKNENVGLYIVSLMSYLNLLYSFNNMGTWSKIKKNKIHIPVTSDGNIDYPFMETYINAIKKECIARLKRYIDKEHKAFTKVIEA